MITLKELERETQVFFSRHWNSSLLASPLPVWSSPWHFSGEIPNQVLPGCYALLNQDKVVYVGVGAGKGPVGYRGAGLGTRLHRYWKRNPLGKDPITGEMTYQSKDGRVTALITIGFERKYGYMAYALESFLIAQLQPEINVCGKRLAE